MRRLRATAAAMILLAATVGLAACSPDDTDAPPAVTVSGPAGAAPTITYVPPLQVDKTYRQQIWAGTGPELAEGKPVLIDFWLENGTDASLVKESYSSTPTPHYLTQEDLGKDLYGTLHGQRVGARMLQVSPAGTSGANGYPTVTVLDVLPTRASGEAVPHAAGMPKVTLDDDGSPSITPTGKPAPTDLEAHPLIHGTGPQVAEGDVITVQYTGFDWKNGTKFDSSWDALPVSFALQDVPAWNDALVDQPVGSQVLIVVPPTYALGATATKELKGETVVFVVDILATGSPSSGSGS
ncbi:FKBP-type peptidyl-prolyl cis-trans isomerase [Cellulomonas alba]|uniref:Peptidyl-prolyl cis-trans isomerase n=1 Tax=Cellulomonas alba TaxID=3053467 RepID=A0ABT7SJL9_9CELL|nr:FKBP-type peptidyl-prolyl cis-trans isomerase [Cellulomonas alba]MDM7856373.1 FKBP-type peptidyl-prolyl cis-trans isomerase [Cellulomonas alba]